MAESKKETKIPSKNSRLHIERRVSVEMGSICVYIGIWIVHICKEFRRVHAQGCFSSFCKTNDGPQRHIL